MAANDRMVWIGLSTSGPDPETGRIESIHVRVTDEQLVVLAEAEPLTVGEDPSEAETATLALIAEHVGKGIGRLAGVRVQELRLFLATHMPALFDHLHYRNIDVGTLRELVRRWYPLAYDGRPSGDGLDELSAAIEELRYYRDVVFIAEQTPQTPVDTLNEDDTAPFVLEPPTE